MKALYIKGIITALVCLGSFCARPPEEPKFDNPVDPKGDNYTDPYAIITSAPAEGETLTVDNAPISWAGIDHVQDFNYSIDGKNWSGWTDATSALFDDLTEGPKTFYIYARYATGDSSDVPVTRTFVVDIIQGPALQLGPKNISVTRGDVFEVEVIADGVDSLMLANVEINYYSHILEVKDVSKGDFLLANGGYVVLLDTTAADTATDQDTIRIETGVSLGNPDYVTGTGVIAEITFEAKNVGNDTLTFTNSCRFKTSRQSDITIINTEYSPVIVQ